MNQKTNPYNHSSFSILTLFVALSIVGLALMPLLQTRLLPNRYQPSVFVYFSMRNASAIVVDNEVTSKLEGAFSRIRGLQKLESRTNTGSAQLMLRFDPDVDLDVIRFEVAAVIRQVYPSLPDGVSYPIVRMTGDQEEDRPERLMSFTLTGKDSNPVVGEWAEKNLVPAFSKVEGVHEVRVYGASPYEWELSYKKEVLDNLGLTPSSLNNQIRTYFRRADLGNVYEPRQSGEMAYAPVIYKGLDPEDFDFEELRIRHKDRLFKITDLVSIKKVVQDPSHFERINALNAINLLITARGSANFLVSAEELRGIALALNKQLPEGYSLQLTYDASTFIKDELQTIVLRISASLLVLFVFVYLVSRSFRYFSIVMLAILVNVVLAFVIYYFIGLTIHIYSLAGIAISLGIVMDNTIVMVDQLRHRKGVSVIRAIIAATLTTIGSLIVVWFLDAETQLKLIDFTLAVVVNLSVSLVVSFFFIPALMDKLPVNKRPIKRRMRKTRRVVRFTRFYGRPLYWLKGKRWLVWIVVVLSFGTPVFMLPGHIKGDGFYVKWYNQVFGSRAYTESVKPVVDVGLGGVLRLFTQKSSGDKFHRSAERTVLNVAGAMDDGTTLEKTNEVFQRIENFLLQYEEVEQFNASIWSSSSARINIHFKPESEFTGFPHQLKSELERFCIDLGGADWQISGVGRAFDNSLNEGRRNNRMVLYGYNLEQLKGYADKLKNYLLEIDRVDAQSIFVNGRATYDSKIRREYELAFDQERMRRTGVSQGRVLSNLRDMSRDRDWVMTVSNQGRHESVYLVEEEASVPDLWEFYNRPLQLWEERSTKLYEYGQFTKKRQQQMINKEDMQYTMVVEFDFIGSWGQQKYFLGQVEDRMRQQLPIGYYVKPMQNYGGWWGEKEKGNKKLWLVLLVIGIIYFISSVVFGSLLQPLLVILLIPVSFIGAFLTFYWFKIPFDEGGFASLVLLSGLTVNSVIYIINDLNRLRKEYPNRPQERLYLKAYNQKIIPIVLTISSTVLGLAPFLIEGGSGVFWTSLSAGTIGGLVFSMLGIWWVLPVFVKKGKKVKSYCI